MKTSSKISISELEAIIKSMPLVATVQVEDDQVVAQLKDNDKNLVLLLVDEMHEKRLICNVPLKMPDDKYADSLMITNKWNRISDSHDTYAYVTVIADRLFIRLESYCLLIGKLDRASIAAWIQNLVDHIHSFEKVILSRISPA